VVPLDDGRRVDADDAAIGKVQSAADALAIAVKTPKFRKPESGCLKSLCLFATWKLGVYAAPRKKSCLYTHESSQISLRAVRISLLFVNKD
jgi:hypothetical protein